MSRRRELSGRPTGFGKYVHHRDLYPVEAPIVRPNRDTLYSFSIFDLEAGPVTITLPNANSYSGATTLTAGAISVGDKAAFGIPPASYGPWELFI